MSTGQRESWILSDEQRRVMDELKRQTETTVSESFVEFREMGLTESGRTRYWMVCEKDAGATLGWIRFFGRWRCYSFYPQPNTAFERKCLRDIATFL